MNTPICDFVKSYRDSNAIRLHMPGHKGNAFIGAESLDITEIDGADVLYSANGIIAESQQNASELFGTARTLYSCEGSSLAIRAMLYLAKLCSSTDSNTILASRNAHKTFMSGVALSGLDVEWLYDENADGILSCRVTPEQLKAKLNAMDKKPVAFYITSPDYLGNIADIKALSQVCKEENILLLCDNAHGAYLAFTKKNTHPIALGAHMCCDSAHKTLPVLTGGAYLHISKNAPCNILENAQRAMSLFASTSPSYLILQSLDRANAYLSDGYEEKLQKCIDKANKLKETLSEHGYTICGDEELKLTIFAKSYGYTGTELGNFLAQNNIICEFCDPDFLVLMFNPENHESIFTIIEKVLKSLPQKDAIKKRAPHLDITRKIISPRQAIFSESETVDISCATGRVLASEAVSCPPAIPVVVCGEEINESAVKLFGYYGIHSVAVTKQHKKF